MAGGSPGAILTSSSAKRVVLQKTASVWRGVARAAAAMGQWSPKLWQSPGNRRILVVAPHPDDEIGCAGALFLHERARDQVHLVQVTDGRSSRAAKLPPDEMARQRQRESEAAGRVLGLPNGHGRWLGLREWEWDEATFESQLRQIVTEVRPHIIYAPSRVDFHPEHVRVAACIARVVENLDLTVRVYQLQVPLTPLLVNLVAPIDAVRGNVVALMRCYPTQAGSIERCLRMKEYGGALYATGGTVEEFWELGAAAYARVHAGSLNPGNNGAFRGVRARPFTDPLSYLRGLDARRALREQSQER